ncbi:class C sortase [Leucobacter sp. CSA1]|uniref:Class C sortase n=2 Tax=Leucobacter chromiisoli TaxID=2796471 RepID=A0A934Q547_9MICO|nr:class C sortase [Leucobacter chromiisoli]
MPWGSFGIGLVAFLGVLVMLYPSTASWFSQYNQSRLIEDVDEIVAAGPDSRLEGEIERARAYNDALTGGALVAAGANVPSSDGGAPSEFDYSSLLNATDTGIMGRLKIPAIEADLPIYHGTDDATLAKGVGHLEGTALPVGGESRHSVLTAHRGLPSADLFTRLDRVEEGDTFTIEVFGEVLTYRVVDTRVVDPDETEALTPEYGRDLVTLVTCTPLGVNSHRILVTGERVTPTPIADIENAGRSPEIPGFPWWAVGLAAAVVLLAAYVWWMGRSAVRRTTPAVDPEESSDPAPTVEWVGRP